MPRFNPWFLKKPHHDRSSPTSPSLSDRIQAERLRQAQWSFNLALGMTTASTLLGFIGAGLLLSGKVPSGIATTAVGIASSVGCIQLAKEANDRLDRQLQQRTDRPSE